jgi:hypothetical protein
MTYASDPNPNWRERLRRWIEPHVAKLDIHPRYVVPVIAVALGFRPIVRGVIGAKVFLFWSDDDRSLYHNAAFFFRFMLPFWIGLGIRWRGRGHGKEFFQCGIGWRRNGQFSANFRIQSDDSAARGTTGPNYGQARCWWEGPK